MKILLENWRKYLNEDLEQDQTMDKLLKLGPVHGAATADSLGMKEEFEKRAAEMIQARKDMIYRLYEIEGLIDNIEKNLDTAWAPFKGTPKHTAYLDQIKELEDEHHSLYPQLINIENLLEPWIGRDKRFTDVSQTIEMTEAYKIRGSRVIRYGRDPNEDEQKIIDIFISNGNQAAELAELALPDEEVTKLIKDQVSATRKFIETVQWIEERHKNFTPGRYRYKDDSWYDEQDALRETTYKIHPRILELAYGADVGELPKIVDQALEYADAIIEFKTPEPYMERGWEALKAWAGI